MRGRKQIFAFFFKKKVTESSVCQNLAAILSIAELSFAESSCNRRKPLQCGLTFTKLYTYLLLWETAELLLIQLDLCIGLMHLQAGSPVQRISQKKTLFEPINIVHQILTFAFQFVSLDPTILINHWLAKYPVFKDIIHLQFHKWMIICFHVSQYLLFQEFNQNFS